MTTRVELRSYRSVDRNFTLSRVLEVTDQPLKLPLKNGGEITVYPRILSKDARQAILEELDSSNLFRQYEVQQSPEPRAHFLLHQDATDDLENEGQPGYRYGSVVMKAFPLHWLPRMKKLSHAMASLFGVDKWSIGVNPVYYRDGKDRIGVHADDAQDETFIATAILCSPEENRPILVRPFQRRTGKDGRARARKITSQDKQFVHQEGEEEYCLHLFPGDVYTMNSTLFLIRRAVLTGTEPV